VVDADVDADGEELRRVPQGDTALRFRGGR
jgi:hypothetical protein